MPESIDAYEKAPALDADYDLAMFNLGGVLWNCGDRERALHTWRRAAEEFPDHELTEQTSEANCFYPSERAARFVGFRACLLTKSFVRTLSFSSCRRTTRSEKLGARVMNLIAEPAVPRAVGGVGDSAPRVACERSGRGGVCCAAPNLDPSE